MGMTPQPPAPEPDACEVGLARALSIRRARELVLEQAAPLTRAETVPVTAATGRRLLEDVRADGDLPPFDRVMMDGFAVRADELAEVPVELPVVGEVAAGASGDEPVPPGQVRAIMTGAPLPPGADSVVPVEWTEPVGDERVRFLRGVRNGQNVAPQGQDLARGSVVAAAGEKVGPLALSLLISSGVARVTARARPRVALLTSGDELVPPGAPVRRGQIRESNGPSLAVLFASAGAEVVELGVARDDKGALAALVEEALACDVVVLTGGSSVGRYDFSAEVVEGFGCTKHFDRLAVKPGKPTLFHTRGETLVFCLPGNPVAALMTGRVLVCPAIRALHGEPVDAWTPLRAPLLGAVKRNAARDQLLPVRRGADGLHFDGWHGSGDLVCMARADAFAFVERGEGDAPPGTLADVFPLPAETAW